MFVSVGIGLLKYVGMGILVFSTIPSFLSFLMIGVVRMVLAEATTGIHPFDLDFITGLLVWQCFPGTSGLSPTPPFSGFCRTFCTHWLVKSSNISFGSSRPSAARWSSTLDLYVNRISSILFKIKSSSASSSAKAWLLFEDILDFFTLEVQDDCEFFGCGFLQGVECVEVGRVLFK